MPPVAPKSAQAKDVLQAVTIGSALSVTDVTVMLMEESGFVDRAGTGLPHLPARHGATRSSRATVSRMPPLSENKEDIVVRIGSFHLAPKQRKRESERGVKKRKREEKFSAWILLMPVKMGKWFLRICSYITGSSY
jgi:hypothetical protein